MAKLLEEYIASKVIYLTNPSVSELRCLNNGWESDVYSFVLHYSDDEKRCQRRLILRAYAGKPVPLFPFKPLREFNVLRQLREDGYPVPEVYLLECDAGYLGTPFVIMELIEGEMMDAVFGRAAAVEKSSLLCLSAKLLTELHGLNVKPYLEDSAVAKGNAIHGEIERFSALTRFFAADYAAPSLAWLWHQAAEIKEQRLALAHWDYHFGNIILTPDGPVVIDCPVSEVTDYRFDLAWSLLFFGDAAKDFLAFYEQARGQAVDQLEFFVAFAHLRRLLVMLIALEHGAESLGMRPGAERIIGRHKAHLQAVYTRWVALSQQPIQYVEDTIARL